MNRRTSIWHAIVGLGTGCLLLAACGSFSIGSPLGSETDGGEHAETPEWFDVELTDVRTGETFTMSDFAGEVVLVETMAVWCPTCIFQGHEVSEMHKMLDDPGDVISVSLDVDLHEEAPALKEYLEEFAFDWRFAISPLEVSRALGNLYSAQYLNPPLSPMLIIDRKGEVHPLEFGDKDAESLLTSLQPFLAP